MLYKLTHKHSIVPPPRSMPTYGHMISHAATLQQKSQATKAAWLGELKYSNISWMTWLTSLLCNIQWYPLWNILRLIKYHNSACVVHSRNWPKLWENPNRMHTKYILTTTLTRILSTTVSNEDTFCAEASLKNYTLPNYKHRVILTKAIR